MAARSPAWARRCCWSRWPATAGCAASQELRRPVRYVLAGSLREPRAVPAAGVPGRAGAGRLGASPTSPGRRSTAGLFVRALAPGGRRLAAAAGRHRGSQLVIGRDLLLRAAVLQLLVPRRRRGGRPRRHRRSWAPTRSPCSCSSSSPWCSTPTRSPPRPWSATRWARTGPRRPGRPPAGSPLWGLGTGVWSSPSLLLALRDVLLAAVHRRPRRPRAGRGRVVVPGRHAAAGRRRLRPRRRADGRRRRRLPAHGHHRLGASSASCRCRCWPCRSAGGWPAIWTGLCLFIALRLVAVLVRVAGDRWLSAPATVGGVSPRTTRRRRRRPGCCWSTSPAA